MQRECCGFVRAYRVPIAPHHANVAHTPTRLPRQPVPPSASTRARWNRLEQPELASQTAARRGAVRGRVSGFVRARGLPVLRSAACPRLKYTDTVRLYVQYEYRRNSYDCTGTSRSRILLSAEQNRQKECEPCSSSSLKQRPQAHDELDGRLSPTGPTDTDPTAS